MGYVPVHWEEPARIPPQGGPKTDGTKTTEGGGLDISVPPAGGYDGGHDD